MKDPDDNTIEITGPYDETGDELKFNKEETFSLTFFLDFRTKFYTSI